MTKLGFKMVVINSKDILREELKTLRSKHSLNDVLNSQNQSELKIKLARASADNPFKVVIYYVSILTIKLFVLLFVFQCLVCKNFS